MNKARSIQSETCNSLVRTGKYTLATFEFIGLASYGIAKAGGAGVKHLAISLQKPIATLNPAPLLSKAMKKIFTGNAKIDKIIDLEQRIAILEERLMAFEQHRVYFPEGIESKKKILEIEKLELLKQLVDMNKSLKGVK